jgi:hypothetical protein
MATGFARSRPTRPRLGAAGASICDIFDSLGGFYSMISATQRGWTIVSNGGRFMGSTIWGDDDRPFNRDYRRDYRPLRDTFQLDNDGTIRLDRAPANRPRLKAWLLT